MLCLTRSGSTLLTVSTLRDEIQVEHETRSLSLEFKFRLVPEGIKNRTLPRVGGVLFAILGTGPDSEK